MYLDMDLYIYYSRKLYFDRNLYLLHTQVYSQCKDLQYTQVNMYKILLYPVLCILR